MHGFHGVRMGLLFVELIMLEESLQKYERCIRNNAVVGRTPDESLGFVF